MEDMKVYIERATQGDEQSFLKIYNAYAKKAYYIALKMCNFCEADAQDIVQDTFMEIHHSLKNLQKPENFKAWMIRILISKGSHKFRDNRDMIVDPDKFLKMESRQEQRQYMIPAAEFNDEADKQILMRMVDQLKPKQKEVLLLQYFEHMSMKEIASALNVPEGTVKTRIMYARNQLKDLVEHYERQEGRKLGFYADGLGGALSVAFMAEFMQHSSFVKPWMTLKRRRFGKWNVSATVMVCTIGIVATCAMATPLLHLEVNEFETAEKVFHPVPYRDEVVVNCRDAYYTLKEWAKNAGKIQKRPIGEINEIRPVFEELKQYEGVYYEKLVKENWAQTFERR